MGTNLASYNNSWYRPGSAIKRFCWYGMNVLFLKGNWFPFYKPKIWLLRIFGAKVGRNVLIKPGVHIKYPWFLEIGDNVWVGEKAWIDNLSKVKIGNNVCLSQASWLLSGNHDYTKTTFDLIIKDIILEDGVWIGAGAVVCGGAVCRENSVLMLGSVAAGELKANGIYRGNPAVWIKERAFIQ